MSEIMSEQDESQFRNEPIVTSDSRLDYRLQITVLMNSRSSFHGETCLLKVRKQTVFYQRVFGGATSGMLIQYNRFFTHGDILL